MSALPSLVRLFPPSESTMIGAVAFDDTVYVGPAAREKIAASCRPAVIPPPRSGSKPTLESAFRRWSGPLDETRPGVPSERLSYKVYPPGKAAREMITVRRIASERPARASGLLHAGVLLLCGVVALLTVVAVAALRDDTPRAHLTTSQLDAVPAPPPAPAARGDDQGLPGVIAPPARARFVKPTRGKGTVARK